MVVGYYTLLMTTIVESQPEHGLIRRFLPAKFGPREVPGILVGKLALDQSLRGSGLGLDLLADAYVNASEAREKVGGVFFLIDPLENESKLRTLYGDFGFKSAEGTERMFLSFDTFNEGSPIDE